MHRKITRIIGIIGSIVCLGIFIHTPSWPTPDKLLIIITFVFMALGQGWEAFKRFAPFVGLLLVYESFRGLVPHLNKHVHYVELITADKFLFFGHLPTKVLQNWWWDGHVRWFDFMFYLVYMLHFILPFSLALLIWKTRETYYWRYVGAFIATSFAGFIGFLVYPAAPPWLASDLQIMPPITRISSSIFYALGVHDFPSVYNKISPNPVAAMPSLHAAFATLFFLFIYKLYGKKWAALAGVYPLLIYVGTIYMGEHYFIDELAGALLAVATFFTVPYIWSKIKKSKTLKAIVRQARFVRTN